MSGAYNPPVSRFRPKVGVSWVLEVAALGSRNSANGARRAGLKQCERVRPRKLAGQGVKPYLGFSCGALSVGSSEERGKGDEKPRRSDWNGMGFTVGAWCHH